VSRLVQIRDEVLVGDLFSGGGGISAAVEILRAKGIPIRVTWAANHWDAAVNFHRQRHPETEVVCQDLCQFDFRRIPGHLDMIWASFACQGNSEAAQPARATNSTLATAHDHLRATAWAVISAVLAKQPRWFIAENVPEVEEWSPPPVVLDTCKTKGAAERQAAAEKARTGLDVRARAAVSGWEVVRVFEKGVLWRHWLTTFKISGWHLTTQVVNCAKWKVPQRRRRMIVVGHRDGEIPIREPKLRREDECSLEPILDMDGGPWKPIDRIERDGARQRAEHADRLFGGAPCWGQHASHKGAWGRPLNRPSTTVTCQNHHWSVRAGEYRLWSVRETAEVMGFPSDYFDGLNRTVALQMAGNAFPPPAGAGVIEQVLGAA
jgi:DNA (cytosine-5)-methyltransferase 1